MNKLLASFLICATGLTPRADFVVAPNDRATQPGNAFLLEGFGTPAEWQSVYGAKNFSGPVLIDGLAFRVDENSAGRSFDVVIPRMTVQASTYAGNFASFDPLNYNKNKGIDNVTVFDASLHWAATDGPDSGVNSFDIKLAFSKPFLYDPAKGGLLIDFAPTGPYAGGIIPDAHVHGDSSIGWLGGSLGNIVTEFSVISVPEPSSIILVTIGALQLLLLKRKL